MEGMKSTYEMVVMSRLSPELLTSGSGSWPVPLRDRQSWLMQKAQLSFCSMVQSVWGLPGKARISPGMMSSQQAQVVSVRTGPKGDGGKGVWVWDSELVLLCLGHGSCYLQKGSA